MAHSYGCISSWSTVSIAMSQKHHGRRAVVGEGEKERARGKGLGTRSILSRHPGTSSYNWAYLPTAHLAGNYFINPLMALPSLPGHWSRSCSEHCCISNQFLHTGVFGWGDALYLSHNNILSLTVVTLPYDREMC